MAHYPDLKFSSSQKALQMLLGLLFLTLYLKSAMLKQMVAALAMHRLE